MVRETGAFAVHPPDISYDIITDPAGTIPKKEKNLCLYMWSVATAMRCSEIHAYDWRVISKLGVNVAIVNSYDIPCRISPSNVLSFEIVHVPGMKGLFWKRCLAPRKEFRYLWLFDSDVETPLVPLSLRGRDVVSNHKHCHSPAQHTSVQTWREDVRPLRSQLDSFKGSCASRRVEVEVMTPMFKASMWERFYEDVLSHIPDDILSVSDFGLGMAFTGLANMHSNLTLVLRDISVVHKDSRTYNSLYRQKAGYDRPHGSLFLNLLDKLASVVRTNPAYLTESFLWSHNFSVMSAARRISGTSRKLC